uniref:Uncharacterized protein n=1 Tax=Podoviridae sp. ctPbe19 TaxID=2826554 RepID=A0A8S5QN89_9CAUD|nr:MAG TPA: hypothetical protein [Podoviridae sp. ctPbe19]
MLGSLIPIICIVISLFITINSVLGYECPCGADIFPEFVHEWWTL